MRKNTNLTLRTLSKDTLIYGVSLVLSRSAAFFTLPIFARQFNSYEYGIVGMLNVYALFLQSVIGLGQGSGLGVVYFSQKNELDRDHVILNSFLLILIASLIYMVALILYSQNISYLIFKTNEHSHYIVLTSVWAIVNVLMTPNILILQYKRLTGKFMALSSIVILLTSSLSVVRTFLITERVLGYILGQIVGHMGAFLVGIKIAELKFKYRNISLDIIKQLAKTGIPLIPSFLFIFIMTNIGRYFLQLFWGLDYVGVYTVCYTIGTLFGLIVSAFTTAWFPFFMSYIDDKEDAGIIFGKVFSLYFYGAGVLLIPFFLYSDELVNLLVTKTYKDAADVIGFVALANFFIGVFHLLLPQIYFKKEVHIVSVLQGISSIVAVGINYVIIKNYGLIGAAASVAITFLFLVLTTCIWNSLRKSNFDLKVIYDLKGLVRVVIIFLIPIFLRHICLFHLSSNLARVSITTLLYLMSITCAFIVLPEEQRYAIFEFVRKNLRRLKCVA